MNQALRLYLLHSFFAPQLLLLANFIQNITKLPFPSVGGYRFDPLRKYASHK
jgi:hypothetical protein